MHHSKVKDTRCQECTGRLEGYSCRWSFVTSWFRVNGSGRSFAVEELFSLFNYFRNMCLLSWKCVFVVNIQTGVNSEIRTQDFQNAGFKSQQCEDLQSERRKVTARGKFNSFYSLLLFCGGTFNFNIFVSVHVFHELKHTVSNSYVNTELHLEKH